MKKTKKILTTIIIGLFFMTTLVSFANSLTVTNPYPENAETDVSFTPSQHVTISDEEGDDMAITWRWWNYSNYWGKNNAYYVGFYKLNMQHAEYINNRTFYCYMGEPSYDPVISQYNHTEDTWLTSVQVGSASAGKSAPSMVINDSGYIWIYYGFHGGGNKVVKSNYPYYIGTSDSDWTSDSWPGCSDAAYIHCINVESDEIYIFYRCGSGNPRRWYYAYSTDGGETWDSTNQLIISTSDGGYGESYVFGMKYQDGKVHMVWHDSDHAYPDVSRNVYYNYFDTSDQHMYNITGADLGTAVDSSADMTASLAYQSPNNAILMETNQGHMDINSTGVPYIIFASGYSNSPELYYWNFTYWDGTDWTTPVNLTDHVIDSEGTTCEIKVYDDLNIKAYLAVPGTGHIATKAGGDIQQYDWNGLSWIYNTTLIYENIENSPLNMGYKVRNALDETAMIACMYNSTLGVTPQNIYCWGKSGTFLRGGGKSWHTFGTTGSPNGTYYMTNDNVTEPNTVYHWTVNVTDSNGWVNNSYYFKTGENENVEFISINGKSNGTTIYDSTPTINWTVVENTAHYSLIIDNDSDFSSPIVNLTNINEYNYPEYCNINATRVSFTLPELNKLLNYGTYYMHVKSLNR